LGDIGRGDDGVPIVLGFLLEHRRQSREVVDGRCGRVDVGHPGGVEGRALAGVRQQRAESFGPVALDALVRPVEPGHVILERGSHRSQVRCPQPLVRRLRIIVGHAS
jgi:hypothetical protein